VKSDDFTIDSIEDLKRIQKAFDHLQAKGTLIEIRRQYSVQ
jgi:hypothetical protein